MIQKRTKWKVDDIAAAVTFRYKSVQFLSREKLKIPLPSVTTLREWIANFKIETGMMTSP